MASRKTSPPRYRELAQCGAHLDRQLDATHLERMAALCPAPFDVVVALDFGVDQDGRITVAGQARATLQLSCHRCLALCERDVEASFDGVLVRAEADAADVGVSAVLVSGDALDVAELVEDELILQLPRDVCGEAACPRQPAMAYGDEDGAAAVPERDNPFRSLETLKPR